MYIFVLLTCVSSFHSLHSHVYGLFTACFLFQILIHMISLGFYLLLINMHRPKVNLVWFKKNGHSSLSFHHSSLITHHLKHLTLFGTITHLSSLNIFQLFVGPILVPCVAFTFFFFFPSTLSS